MKLKLKILMWCIVALTIFLLLIWVLPNASAIEDDQLIYCDDVASRLNQTWSFTECIEFWANVTDILNQTPIIVNNTIIQNQTIEVEIETNCTETFEFQKEQNRHIEELYRLNASANVTIISSCQEEIQIAVDKARQEEKDKCGVCEEEDFTFWWLSVLLLGAGNLYLYFVFPKRQKSPSGGEKSDIGELARLLRGSPQQSQNYNPPKASQPEAEKKQREAGGELKKEGTPNAPPEF